MNSLLNTESCIYPSFKLYSFNTGTPYTFIYSSWLYYLKLGWKPGRLELFKRKIFPLVLPDTGIKVHLSDAITSSFCKDFSLSRWLSSLQSPFLSANNFQAGLTLPVFTTPCIFSREYSKRSRGWICLQHTSLGCYLPSHWCSATVYLRWCPRQTGYSVMGTFFCWQSCFPPLLGWTFLCPPHLLLAQTLVPRPLNLCGPFGNVIAQHGKHSYCLLSANHVLSLEPQVCNTNCPAFPQHSSVTQWHPLWSVSLRGLAHSRHWINRYLIRLGEQAP